MSSLKQLAVRWLRAALSPIPLVGVLQLPRYLSDWIVYSNKTKIRPRFIDSYPCLSDATYQTGFDAHYFYQAAWLARRLAKAGPMRHIDIGSDVRLVSVISAFIETEFVDYRPLPVQLNGLTCSQGNLTVLENRTASIESLSCLHVVEHVGLGRYGDPIDPEGSSKALTELERVLSFGGSLYLSVPVGRERVCFNAHRVFSPLSVVAAFPTLTLCDFSIVDDDGRFFENQPLLAAKELDYGCGMFHFEKRIDA
jgi:hypothetical protein